MRKRLSQGSLLHEEQVPDLYFVSKQWNSSNIKNASNMLLLTVIKHNIVICAKLSTYCAY